MNYPLLVDLDNEKYVEIINKINESNIRLGNFKIKKSLKLDKIEFKFNENLIENTLIQLTINTTKIKDISNINLSKLVVLESLDLYDNRIEIFNNEIPNSLTYISLSHNNLKEINIDSKNLERLDLTCNNLDYVPNCLDNVDVNYSYNNFNFGVNKINRRRLIEVYKNKKKVSNNVHESHIQKITRESIEKLIDLKLPSNPNFMKEIIKYYYKYTHYFYIIIPDLVNLGGDLIKELIKLEKIILVIFMIFQMKKK